MGFKSKVVPQNYQLLAIVDNLKLYQERWKLKIQNDWNLNCCLKLSRVDLVWREFMERDGRWSVINIHQPATNHPHCRILWPQKGVSKALKGRNCSQILQVSLGFHKNVLNKGRRSKLRENILIFCPGWEFLRIHWQGGEQIEINAAVHKLFLCA